MFKVLTSLFIALFSCPLLYGYDFAAPKIEEVTIRVFTADWCHACKIFQDFIKKGGIGDNFAFYENDRKTLVPVQFVDVDSLDDEAVIAAGKKGDGIPEIQIVIRKETSAFVIGAVTKRHKLRKLIAEGMKNYEVAHSLDTLSTSDALSSKGPNSLDASVVLLGTGYNYRENPISVGMGIKKIKKNLEQTLGVPASSTVTLYGNGQNSAHDAIHSTRDLWGRYTNEPTKVPDVAADAVFDRETLRGVFRDIREQKKKNALLVFLGHGSREGIRTWNEFTYFKPSELQQYTAASKANTVIVSGNCYGGQFAKAAACGFFSARPDTTSLGCWNQAWLSEKDLRDYTNVFFESMSKPKADFDGNGEISFSEAHWYATLENTKRDDIEVEEQDSTYTTLDALADDYFDKYPYAMADYIDLESIPSVLALADAGEKAALKGLLKSFSPSKLYLRRTGIQFNAGGIEGMIAVNPFGSSVSLENLYFFSPQDRRIYYFKALALPDAMTKAIKAENLYILVEVDRNTLDIRRVKKAKPFTLPPEIRAYQQFSPLDAKGKRGPLYPRTAVQIIRRLIFKSWVAATAAKYPQLAETVADAQRCETQSISRFLGTKLK